MKNKMMSDENFIKLRKGLSKITGESEEEMANHINRTFLLTQEKEFKVIEDISSGLTSILELYLLKILNNNKKSSEDKMRSAVLIVGAPIIKILLAVPQDMRKAIIDSVLNAMKNQEEIFGGKGE